MKSVALVLTLLCAPVALGSSRNWKDARVTNITSDAGGSAVAPVRTMRVAVPITRVYYWIETEDTTYILGPAITKRQSLNITLHGKTKIATDGRTAHILDDDGKDKKIPIAQKVARQVPTEVPNK